ncbi:glycosyltransferase family 4 protein [Flavobacterium sp. FlaQc-30]|uniref:glycosyltransferase family 4 protein n=1 Tax=Flavobacterium sp. FlaQc-30 TaxID=3374179 RepID=UPI003756745E
MAKVILLSQVPLPFSKIGSWTTLYNNYLEKNNEIDYIVCPKPEDLFKGVKYSFVQATFWSSIQNKVFKKKKNECLKALNKIIVPNENYIIQIVDNYGMAKPLKEYLVSKGVSKNCCIQFFYHGFSPYAQPNSQSNFYELINELVVLTHDSYKLHKETITTLPSHFSILYNGIDTNKFKRVSVSRKQELKKILEFDDKKVFVWCSQDRPKKGLHIILEAWKKIYNLEKNIVLIVIGCESENDMDGVKFLGKIPNHDLPEYYQASDCYLFPTLCQEGFGLSLIEALHCGNYCIASAMGGVPEVLQYGKLGRLIQNPDFVLEWVDAINDFLNGKFEFPEFSSELYSSEKWNVSMNELIANARKRMQ